MRKAVSISQAHSRKSKEQGSDRQRVVSLEINRTCALAAFAKRARGRAWNRALFRLLLEELWVTDEFEALVGPPEQIPAHRYAEAVAVAIVLRHSWRRDDFVVVRHALESTTR